MEVSMGDREDADRLRSEISSEADKLAEVLSISQTHPDSAERAAARAKADVYEDNIARLQQALDTIK